MQEFQSNGNKWTSHRIAVAFYIAVLRSVSVDDKQKRKEAYNVLIR
ncbi:hypothetical protein IGI58_000239 [Enterococcus sp. AZ020]